MASIFFLVVYCPDGQDILLIPESQAMVTCLIQIKLAQMAPVIKPIEMIIMPAILPVPLLHIK
jgi:hypothetical protein